MTKPTTVGPSLTITPTMPRSVQFLSSTLQIKLTRTVGVTADPADWPNDCRAMSQAHDHFIRGKAGETWLVECSAINATALRGWADDLEIRGQAPDLVARLREVAGKMKAFLREQSPEPVKKKPSQDSLKAAVAKLAE